MNSIWGRVTAAAILSLSVFGATQYFAQKYRPSSVEEPHEKTIAFIQDMSEEVEKRSSNSLVWKGISQGENLHTGEAIKTSPQGEVRIQFTDSARFIDLDPESLIVLHQENENEIALDLLGGSLFVHQDEKAPANAPALTLNSPKGKIDLSQATAQLSKSANKDVDVQVLKGKAKILNNGQVQELGKDQQLSSLEILSPRLDQILFLNASDPQPVSFQWKGFPEKTLASLWLGKTRKNLKELSKTDSVDKSSLTTQLSAGNYFWKLAAKDPASLKIVQESPLYRLKIENRYPPSMVQPAQKASLTEKRTEFKWLKPESAQSVSIVVAKDSALKEKVFSKTVADSESLSEELNPGVYFWQLSASYKETQELISSPVHSFSVGLPAEEEKPKVPVVISWLAPTSESPQYFITGPKAGLSWTTEQKNQVRNWRLKLATSEAELKDEKSTPIFQTETIETHVEAPLPKPGRYLAMVEALDEKNQVLASSVVKDFEISPLPLLPAPEFEPRAGDFSTNSLGRLNVKWTDIKGAKEYWLTLMDSTGKEIRKARFQRNSTVLSNLLPGQYQISVLAVDEHGRESLKSPARVLKVPEKSSVLPPKFKKIEVEQ